MATSRGQKQSGRGKSEHGPFAEEGQGIPGTLQAAGTGLWSCGLQSPATTTYYKCSELEPVCSPFWSLPFLSCEMTALEVVVGIHRALDVKLFCKRSNFRANTSNSCSWFCRNSVQGHHLLGSLS